MTDRNPMVSIVCTNFNKGEWIREAIDSFLAQESKFTYEIILIDDASTDVSPKIIKEYAETHPDRIRAFYNRKNLGITKTWIKACEMAKGKYIARCDGDDYWTDTRKLQKQVDQLEKNKDSLWCSTDYNIITSEGKLTHFSAFEKKLVDRSDSYAGMLATKGFTMSSTWLVDANLMREINAGIDSSAVDDTFNIQLDLFNKTKLTYLHEAMVVYRLHDGSDSRPIEIEKIRSRNKRLLKTQLEYIKKYKDVDYGEILEILLPRAMQYEVWAIERLQIIQDQRSYIKQQETKIKELERTIHAITESRSYRLSTIITSPFRLIKNIPNKLVNRYMQLATHYQYQKHFNKNLQSDDQLMGERETSKKLTYKPLISVIVPTYNTPSRFFLEMIDSVMNQTYTNWELVLIDDASPDESIRKLIRDAASSDKRVKYKFLKNNHHIAGATNEGIDMASGDFIALLDHDDILQSNALFEVVDALNKNKNIDFIYTDEDKVSDKNRHIQPFLKPSWNPDFLYSVNYITHFSVIRKSVLDKVGHEDGKYNGAQDWELFLRVARNIPDQNVHHIDKILYSWRMHGTSTAKLLETKPYVIEAQRKVIENDLEKLSVTDFTLAQDRVYPGQWQLMFNPKSTPKISIFVSDEKIKDQKKYIQEHTDYPDYEVLPKTSNETYGNLLSKTSGDILVIIDSNLKITDKNWLSLLLGDAQRKDIGCVLSQLKSENDVMKIVENILTSSAFSIVKKLSRTNVGKHLYLTTRYNIQKIYSGVVMVEVSKLDTLSQSEDKLFSLTDISEHMIAEGYRNLYNPYVRVTK